MTTFEKLEMKLKCIKEELDLFKDATPYSAKQYSDAIQRIKSLLEEK